MADLEFSKTVPDVPASSGPSVPKPYQRTESVQVTPFPDFQSALSRYAEDTNWMSTIGSAIASKASDAVATRIGGELGKNPQGNIGIPLTNFDKTMQASYETQAQATLGLQADKLITDSNIETAKATRITPQLIDKTNQNITTGLKNILKNAPDSIKANMELQFGHQVLNQTETLTRRMIGEQKEDQKNNNDYASRMNAEYSYSFGLKGNDKAGLAAVENTRKLNEASVASRLITPEQAKVNIDTARKSYLNGKIIHEYNNATNKEAYLKSIADKKPSYLSDNDYIDVTNHLMNYVNHQNALRSEDQQLQLAKFNNTLYTNLDDAAIQLNELKDKVTPLQFEKATLDYKKIAAKNNQLNTTINDFIPQFHNATAFATASNDLKNRTFDKLVRAQVTQSQSSKNPMNVEEAQVVVAASAPGPISSFISELNTKAGSGNPADIDMAGKQVHALYQVNAGRVLTGLTADSKALFSKFESLRSTMNPVDAAKLATDIVYNQASKNATENQQSWSNFVTSQSKGIPHSEWALKQVDYDVDNFVNPSMAHVYGADILDLYNTYYKALNGDSVTALKNVKREVEENYGETYVNGKPFVTLHPLEKVLGYNSRQVVPAIQMDTSDYLENKFLSQKEMYSKGQVPVYWQVVKREKSDVFSPHPVQVEKITKTGNTEKRERFDIIIQGNAFNEYDISVKSKSGMIPLFQAAPYLGITTYIPNKERIDKYFNAYSSHPAYANPLQPYAFEKSLIANNVR